MIGDAARPRSRSQASAPTRPSAWSRTTSSRSSSTRPTSGSSSAPASASAGSRRTTQALSDLALPAARQALEQAGLDGTDIDLLIVATVTPDMMFPSTSAILADQLGAEDAAAYDLSAGCTGFMYALAQAYGMLAAGLSRRALVVGGDVLSRILDWSDRSTVVLFGDGAGAVVLERVGRGGLPRLRARRRRRRRRAPLAAGQRLAPVRRSRPVREDERPRGLQVRDARPRPVGRGRARALRGDDRRRRRLRPAPGERSHHRSRNQEARDPVGSGGDQCRPLRQHVLGLDPARARRSAGGRKASAGQARTHDGNGRRAHMGKRADAVDDGMEPA